MVARIEILGIPACIALKNESSKYLDSSCDTVYLMPENFNGQMVIKAVSNKGQIFAQDPMSDEWVKVTYIGYHRVSSDNCRYLHEFSVLYDNFFNIYKNQFIASKQHPGYSLIYIVLTHRFQSNRFISTLLPAARRNPT